MTHADYSWMVWYLDRAGSIATRWPAGFEVQDCLTPFPAETPETTVVSYVECWMN
jgi:hypothetical protein